MNGSSGTVDHSFASTIQNFGACLTCHLANVPVIYGTSIRKVNVFHARPEDWFRNGNDQDDGGGDRMEVLRGGPGRETFRVFGDDQQAVWWPLGDLRGQGLSLCGFGKTYEKCSSDQQDRWKEDLQNSSQGRGKWDNPVNGFHLRMTIPCGNWNDDDTRIYCDGSTKSVPYFNN